MPIVYVPLASRRETKLVTGGTWRQDLWAQSGCMEVSRREDWFLRTPWRLVPGKSIFVDSLTNILINNLDTRTHRHTGTGTGTVTPLVKKLNLTKNMKHGGAAKT